MMSTRGLNRAIGDSGSGRWGEAVGVEGRHHGCCCFFSVGTRRAREARIEQNFDENCQIFS
eukprot:scaffold4432_cov76-Cyclotella_meneghiniana.AAC.12